MRVASDASTRFSVSTSTAETSISRTNSRQGHLQHHRHINKPPQQQQRSRSAQMKEDVGYYLSLIHISEPTRLLSISNAVFCLKKKKTAVSNNNKSRHHIKQMYS
eukprot:TRINITY_DN52602_c0_g1_i1.p1 TRINITY_DN52602_c0_g1~~TRINITY_DN52602_c0_g1_i1.p1  ORF type:complete len:105 (-),score=23.37 TRINITY_DN52602_c0_g1_i1:6-320(-)